MWPYMTQYIQSGLGPYCRRFASVNGRVIGRYSFCLSASLMSCYGVGMRTLGVLWCSS
jgi:hypothetical protein